jgi:hypothetical protein
LFKLVIKIPSGKLLFILTAKDFRSELVLFETLIDKTFSPYFNLTGIEEFAKKSKETKKMRQVIKFSFRIIVLR